MSDRTTPDTANAESPPESAATPEAAAPEPPRRPRLRLDLSNGWGLASIAAISFSLTFVAGGIALLAGLLPSSFASLQPPVDLGVLMLMVPLCALVLTMLAEVLRAALTGLPRLRPPRAAPALSDWPAGRGEG